MRSWKMFQFQRLPVMNKPLGILLHISPIFVSPHILGEQSKLASVASIEQKTLYFIAGAMSTHQNNPAVGLTFLWGLGLNPRVMKLCDISCMYDCAQESWTIQEWKWCRAFLQFPLGSITGYRWGGSARHVEILFCEGLMICTLIATLQLFQYPCLLLPAATCDPLTVRTENWCKWCMRRTLACILNSIVGYKCFFLLLCSSPASEEPLYVATGMALLTEEACLHSDLVDSFVKAG